MESVLELLERVKNSMSKFYDEYRQNIQDLGEL